MAYLLGLLYNVAGSSLIFAHLTRVFHLGCQESLERQAGCDFSFQVIKHQQRRAISTTPSPHGAPALLTRAHAGPVAPHQAELRGRDRTIWAENSERCPSLYSPATAFPLLLLLCTVLSPPGPAFSLTPSDPSLRSWMVSRSSFTISPSPHLLVFLSPSEAIENNIWDSPSRVPKLPRLPTQQ